MGRSMIFRVKKCQCPLQDGGFTLVEMMIALAIGAIIMTAVMTSFVSQQRSYIAQDDAVEMQQNARVAMEMMSHDIRSAGFDPNGLGAGITTAGVNNLVFTRDDGNGTGTLETIRYALMDAFNTEWNLTTCTSNVIGRNDGIADDLGRDAGECAGAAGLLPVAENISQLQFRYLNAAGNVTATLADIRSVQIFILAVASNRDSNITNTLTYTYPTPGVPIISWGPFNDNFRRRLLVTTVQCRNLGL